MRKRLQLASMLTATTATATFFSLSVTLSVTLSLFFVLLSVASARAWAAEGDGRTEMVATTDEHGRTIYVNEPVSAHKRTAQSEAQSAPARHSSLGVLEQHR